MIAFFFARRCAVELLFYGTVSCFYQCTCCSVRCNALVL